MKVGIDFGTTHAVAAVVDRDNYLAVGPSVPACGGLPDLHHEADLARRPVDRREDGPDVEVRYLVTAGGAVEVTLTTRPAGLTRAFQLARHALAGP